VLYLARKDFINAQLIAEKKTPIQSFFLKGEGFTKWKKREGTRGGEKIVLGDLIHFGGLQGRGGQGKRKKVSTRRKK